MPGTDVPQRVTVLYRGVQLGAGLLALQGEHRHVTVIDSPVELVNGPPADVVVIDVPAPDRRAVCEEVRRHHRGPLIVLLGQGESGRDLPPDHNRKLLTHPFSIRRLSVALAMPTPTLPAWDPAAHLQLVPSPVARAGGPDTTRGAAPRLVAQAVPRLVRSWRERRLVRVSAISVMAVLLFMSAFAVVSQGDHCGSLCDELTGADLVAPPSSTTALLGEAGPDMTGPGAGRVDPTTSDPGAGPTANGESQVDGAGTGATPSSATSASSSGAPAPAPDPTSPPGPTRPQPTTAPTTTTRPNTSTSTSTSTTATTATTTTTTSIRP